jgi:hypothetical protein
VALVGQSQELEAPAGQSFADWSLEGGTLTVHVHGWDGVNPLSVMAQPFVQTAQGRTGAQAILRHGDSLPAVLTGLPPGEYVVDVREQTGGEPGRLGGAIAVLESGRAGTEVVVDLRRQDRWLSVALPDGTPAGGASVLVGGQRPLPALGPGVFSLENIAAGESLTILAPGMSPVCRWALPTDHLVVTLERGVAARVRFAGRSGVRYPVGLIVPPGSQCRVPLRTLPHQLLAVGPDETVEFLIGGLPNGPHTYVMAALDDPSRWQTIVPTEGGLITIELPRQP